MGEYGLLYTGTKRQRVVSAWALASEAGLAYLEATRCGWKEFNVKLGWNWVFRYIA